MFKINKNQAVDLILNSKGRFITIEFIKKDQSLRVINGQLFTGKNPPGLGYIRIKESRKVWGKRPIRNVNTQTIKKVSINGKTYTVNS